jgi:NitT/TauT family transport system ATP-binding protein
MAEAPTPVIEARLVSKTYGAGTTATAALADVSFAIAEGQFVSLVGPSGCGKSTLLQILGGLIASSAGEVLVDGERVTGPLPGKIAVVFQDATLLPWKTALENVLFPLEAQRVPREMRAERALEMLELVGLAGFAEKFPHQLSGGMKQRVSIARGLAQNPRIILMDEPFGALDEQTRLKMGHELVRIWDRTRKTIFFITHSLTEALYLSDRVLVMSGRPGRIIDRVEAGLARPRHFDMIGSAEFGQARNRIWRLIAADEEPAP